MELTTPALLFPAISLLFLAYNARFLALASLVRNLESEYSKGKSRMVYEQIRSIRKRIILIQCMEGLGVLSFLLCVLSMFLLFNEQIKTAEFIFGTALVVLFLSLVCALIEIQVSARALEILLKRVEAPEEMRTSLQKETKL